MNKRKIELLAPAGNLTNGIAAIQAGADAVYIGGPSLGARERAGNSMEDIARLAEYAHQFGAKVYQTVNTIIYDHELDEAQQMAWKAWECGVDALIIQDMALLEMDLPEIPLHASTQTFNLTSERVMFLEKAGFDRVILERALTLEEIRQIREKTTVELEAFVHGALCVGYSGQCYLSHAICGRSGNRGACAQPCRSNWNLETTGGKVLHRNKPLLSLGDLNLSENLEDLISAGVTSFKIEGRLKDQSYVINNVAHYNQKLTQLGVERTSSGRSIAKFTPNPEKSFSRSFSTFLFEKRRPTTSLMNRFQGEFLGTVIRVGAESFTLDNHVQLNNGDGLSFRGRGTNVNSTRGQIIYPNRMEGIEVGTRIYRNLDRSFNPEAERKIEIRVIFEHEVIIAKDQDGNKAKIAYTFTEPANNVERTINSIQTAFKKSGDTIFEVSSVDVLATPFMPISVLNELRRSLLEELRQARLKNYQRPKRININSYPQLSVDKLDYLGNVANRLSRQFYEKCGVQEISSAFEVECPQEAVLLRTRHCIRRELGMCLIDDRAKNIPLFLENNGRRFSLKFDCAACEMMILNS